MATLSPDEIRRIGRAMFWKSLQAPFVMWYVIRLRKLVIWDEHETPFVPMEPNGQLGPAILVRRGDLPAKYKGWETPDERLPGGLYEPGVLEIYRDKGPLACAWHWLGLRNRANGFEMEYAKPATHYWPQTEGRFEQGEGDNAIYLERKFYLGRRFERLRGYRVYSRDGGKTFYATPVWTIKRA